MLTIKLRDPHWLENVNPENDLCAHGGVEVLTDGITFSDGAYTNWTVSASALYFLRTLTQDHTKDNPVCEHLIPCCGFCMYAQGEGEDVILFGCPNGINFEVKHKEDKVILKKSEKEEIIVPLGEWQQAVYSFADSVEAFYRSSQPKQTSDQSDEEGYKAFWAEWKRRRHAKGS
jgi:hypothetical protein